MFFNRIQQTALLNLKNIPGKRFEKKIIVIECDDWGGIRMPSKKVYETLVSKKIPFPSGHFDMYDTLEDKPDLEALFGLLMEFQDSDGNHPVITPIVNLANPDYKKIKESDYQNYYYETYPQSLISNHRHPDVLSLWKQGIELNIFVPEYHGREHLTVQMWLNELKKGNKDLLEAFSLGYTTVLIENIHPVVNGFRPQFFFDDIDQKEAIGNSIEDGASLFYDIFGYRPNVFVPSNAVFHPDFEKNIITSGIKYLNVNHIAPVPDGKGGIKNKRYYYTRKHKNGLTYYLRNCAFEPSGDNYNDIGLTLKQIEAAFRWNKPAIISTHRVNFVGGINPRNSSKGLKELKSLLNAILKKWPKVHFMSTRDLIQMTE
jgi:hypothetical protein